MDEDLEQLLQTVEEDVATEVRAILDELADAIAAELADATEIVAARFSLSRITSMWRERVPRVMRRLFRVAQTAGEQAATHTGAQLPDDWDDLPARYDDGRLPPSLGDYAEATEHLLRAVGERLTEAAVAALAEGLDAGEDTEALRARLRALFAADGTQLGETREERIARTESTRAWNAATLAAAQDLTGPDRPLVKQWITRHDQRVRETHADADAQLQLLDEPFTVGGVDMAYPGDPTAPANLTVNCRCVLALARAETEQTAATSPPGEGNPVREPHTTAAATDDPPPILTWSTPEDAALAFIGQQTGDGRVFAEGSLYWEGGPWPLQYADEMGAGHDGAELAGAIQTMDIDGPRLTGTGVLYLTQRAGAEAAMLLAQGAPLGVSVDLDSVDVELVDNTISGDEDGADLVLAAASFASMSVLRLADDGGWMITASSAAEWTASGTAMSRSSRTTQLISGPGGSLTAAAARALFPGALTAAAGDPDNPETGTVVHTENAGDLLVRITRARVRGATLVAMPAYDKARIVLDDVEPEEPGEQVAAAGSGDYERVIAHVCAAPVPVSARDVAKALDLPAATVRRHLAKAATAGRLVRISRGLYTGPSTLPESDATASADGAGIGLGELEASAWRVMQEQPPMPASWFREPTVEELPPDSGGVHYKDGRVYGWVAQAGVPHEVHGRKVQIDKLGKIDTSYFLRAKFDLDDGSEIAVGAITMNVGHHRDGAECETAACQFDDTRTVAGIVTVGMNRGGMWFSGAAAPWLSDWDLTAFRACQPSYHMTQDRDGTWQLKAVLSVPVPGHPSKLAAAAHLAATAVVERSNLALTAAAAAIPDSPDEDQGEPEPQHAHPAEVTASSEPATAPAVRELTAALLTPEFLDELSAALHRRETERAAQARAEIQQLAAVVDGVAA
ncbi:hypothetical protein KYY02_19490 [Streptomyces pimonensis]|uniref:Phage head morphogenesis domain-containing protein n=1 Tax=Streptomyces pimonensis TaxID=2860288 RepID=A0ABV4J451_9ACTN